MTDSFDIQNSAPGISSDISGQAFCGVPIPGCLGGLRGNGGNRDYQPLAFGRLRGKAGGESFAFSPLLRNESFRIRS
jgi:hypothetical protein